MESVTFAASMTCLYERGYGSQMDTPSYVHENLSPEWVSQRREQRVRFRSVPLVTYNPHTYDGRTPEEERHILRRARKG